MTLVQSKVVKSSALSIGKVADRILLSEKDKTFKVFWDNVDTVMLNVMNECYGRFSNYTVPISI